MDLFNYRTVASPHRSTLTGAPVPIGGGVESSLILRDVLEKYDFPTNGFYAHYACFGARRRADLVRIQHVPVDHSRLQPAGALLGQRQSTRGKGRPTPPLCSVAQFTQIAGKYVEKLAIGGWGFQVRSRDMR